MMSRRRRMNAAASRPAIVRARAAKIAGRPFSGSPACKVRPRVSPPYMSYPHSGLDSQDELNPQAAQGGWELPRHNRSRI